MSQQVLDLCARAFADHPPDARRLRHALRESRGVDVDASDRELVRCVVRFAAFLAHPDSKDTYKMSVFLKRFVLVHARHPVVTHTFLMEYMIRQAATDNVDKRVVVVFVHDVTCDASATPPLPEEIATTVIGLVGCTGRSVLVAEVCLLKSIVARCRIEVFGVLGALERLYTAVATSPALLPVSYMASLCEMLSIPVVVSHLHFREKFLDRVVADVHGVLCGTCNVNVLQSAVSVSEVICAYMRQGPYFTNIMFLKLGSCLERHPWLPLVEAFATGVPQYPFPSSTWQTMETLGLNTGAQSTRLAALKRALTSGSRLDWSGRCVAVDGVRPGEWHCRSKDVSPV